MLLINTPKGLQKSRMVFNLAQHTLQEKQGRLARLRAQPPVQASAPQEDRPARSHDQALIFPMATADIGVANLERLTTFLIL